jgi:hypothetical protein
MEAASFPSHPHPVRAAEAPGSPAREPGASVLKALESMEALASMEALGSQAREPGALVLKAPELMEALASRAQELEASVSKAVALLEAALSSPVCQEAARESTEVE